MDAPFAVMAEALADIARQERMRIMLTNELAMRGQAEPVRGIELEGWRVRANRIEDAAALLHALVPFETTVRALDPALARPTSKGDPTFWPPSDTN